MMTYEFLDVTMQPAMLPKEYVKKHPEFSTSGFGFILKWRCKNIGFGEITVAELSNGDYVLESETVNDDFVAQAFDFWSRTCHRT